jgi:hypothetical protein
MYLVNSVVSRCNILWLDKKYPEGKKISPGFCAKKNIIRLSGRKRIIRFHQKSAADKRDAIFHKIRFVKSLIIQCLQLSSAFLPSKAREERKAKPEQPSGLRSALATGYALLYISLFQ